MHDFDHAVRDFFDDTFRARPSLATWAGDHRFDGALDDVSPEAVEAERRRLLDWRARFDRAAVSGLEREADRAILLFEIDRLVFEIDGERAFARNPLTYTSLWGNALHNLLARDFAPIAERLAAFVSRLLALPAATAAAARSLTGAPRVHLETALEQLRGVEDLARIDPGALGSPVSAGLADDLARARAPALSALARFGEHLLRLREGAGDTWALGEPLLRRKLALAFHDAAVTPEAVRAWAERAVEEVRAEMIETARAAGFTGAGDEPVRTALARIARDHCARGALLEACRAAVGDAERFLASHPLVTLPSEPLAVEWTPPFARGVSTAMLDAPGPLDRAQRSFFFVSPLPGEWSEEQAQSFLREYNRRQLQLLAVHEALPGHYVQLGQANRCASLPRTVFANGAFVEGWAVYAERVMVEQGFGDLLLRLARLKFFLRAVVNALIDVGLHAFGMGEAEAMDRMVRGAFQEESEARGKYRRARLTSVQLSTYFVGFGAIQGVVRELKERGLSLKAAHDALLAHGSPPPVRLRALLGLDDAAPSPPT